jgi:predicted ATPase/DNA-binding winged helix-turn-helix (wHTH) protein
MPGKQADVLEMGRYVRTTPPVYRFGEFKLDAGSGCVFRSGREIRLRPKVYEALKYLLENAGRLVGKEELMKALWPDSAVTDDSLVQCMLELRRALDDRGQQLLKTVPKRGYLFTAEVMEGGPNTGGLELSRIRGRTGTNAPKRRNLPAPRTSLVGRERDVADASELVLRPDVRLLSITGPGGAGKTRLALAVAAGVADRFVAGVQFVGLASIGDPELVATTLADALEIQQVANRTVAQLISDQLQNRGPFLLVIDNFEQVLSAATVLAQILEACPSLTILVTSRSCLRIYGEQEFPVRALAESSAVELFTQRAAAVSPDFELTSENKPVIQGICARLDGLPLAIELAAARIKILPPRAILERLKSRLKLLTGGALDLPERQQTLRNTIDWSYGLLNEIEAKLFRRLSVFAGGCGLEAAEAVCDTGRDLGIDLFEGLSSLVGKNLMQRVNGDAEPRFAMLETIREYALARLAESGEEPAVRRSHAAYCLVLAEEGNPELNSAERARWLKHCDIEIDNFRSALEWLFEARELEWSLRLCAALFRFWDMREHLAEGRARLETVLRLGGAGHIRERARVSQFVGALATPQGDYAAAGHYLHQSLSLYEESGDKAGVASSLNALGVSARDRGDYTEAETNLERSLACWRTLSDRPAVARCLHNLADVVKHRGDYSRAGQALGEAVEIFEELGDRSGAAWSVNQQGDIAREQGDLRSARDLYQRALSAFRQAGDGWGSARSLTDLAYLNCLEGNHSAAHAECRESLQIFAGLRHRRGIARVLEGFACLAANQGHAGRALRLHAAATHLRELIGAPLHHAEQHALDQKLRGAWGLLSEAEGKRVWAEGLEMGMERAIEYALGGRGT